MWKDFREFVLRGNVLDLAVGIIIGAAFGTIVTSLVKDVIMPPVGLAIGNVDFASLFVVLKDGTPAAPYASLADAQAAGAVTLNYGTFINTIIIFIIVAFAVFMIVRVVNKARKATDARKEAAAVAVAPATKDCPFCLSKINVNASRCPACTSQLGK
ncbi:MAG: mechanosensitive ion channel protein MscL [Chloroflexi bacterium RBG_16_56_11]|nr:MAG: mechanosensitive ion channel protein MscL [Chloroflexi bacterium RBG_16_56_11]